MAFTDDIRRFYRTGGISVKIIFVLTAAFLITSILNFIVLASTEIIPGVHYSIHRNLWWLSMPSDFSDFIRIPWTIVTHGIVHSGFGHWIFNMLGIWIFGRIVSQYIDDRRFLSTFILSVVFGGIFYLGVLNAVFPASYVQMSRLVGASGGLMGLLGAALFLAPNMRFNLAIVQPPLWLVAILYLLADFAVVTSYGSNAGGSLAHLGGFAFGYVSSMLYQRGTDIVGWLSRFIDWLVNLFKGARNPRPKMKVKYRSSDFKTSKTTTKNRKSDAEFNMEKKDRQAKIDAILDKIKRSGYESLSKAEKDFLFNEGKRL